MRSIVGSMITLAKEQGVVIKLNEKKTKVIPTAEGYTLELENGTVQAKQLICAIDHVNFYKKVLKDDVLYKKHAKEERSTSAVVFYWAVERKHDNVGLHNIIFSSDYKKEFKQLFDDKVVQDEATIYIHNSSAVEADHAPENGQNWFVMINAPAGVDVPEERLEVLRQYMKKCIKDALGIDLENKILHEENWSMRKIEKDTGSFTGSLYGGAFNNKTASFKRHGNQSKKYKNLYFTGGSVHPGGGIPLVLKSAKIVDELMQKNG
jgi:phytoene dehydrogenase-like protein